MRKAKHSMNSFWISELTGAFFGSVNSWLFLETLGENDLVFDEGKGDVTLFWYATTSLTSHVS